MSTPYRSDPQSSAFNEVHAISWLRGTQYRALLSASFYKPSHLLPARAAMYLSCCPFVCLQRQAPSIFMFGFMSLIFTMRERVESSMEMVRTKQGILDNTLD